MSEPSETEPPRIRIAPETGGGETSPHRASAPAQPRRGRSHLPVATIALLSIIAATTVLEFVLARSTDPPPSMLMALGGMNSTAVRAGEWYRLLTAALLHGGILHLVLNGLALLFGGSVVESLANRAWLVTIAVGSAVSGSLLGVLLNDASIVSVGASGSIMGILAAGAVLAFRLPAGPQRTQLLATLARFLIPSLLPLATTSTGGRIDYSAHIGGALGGALLGGILVAARLYDRATIARVVAGLSISFVAASVGAEVKKFPEQAEDAMLDAAVLLVPDAKIPKDWHLAGQTVETWGKDRPRDPRVHMFRALKLLDDNDAAAAERELRTALGEEAILRKFFPDRKLEIALRSILVTLLKDQGRLDDAKHEAAPVCAAGEDGTIPSTLQKLDVCPPH